MHAGCAADQGGGRWEFFIVVLWLFLGNPSLCIPPLQDDGKHFGSFQELDRILVSLTSL